MCDCKSKLEAKLLDRFKAMEPNAKNHYVELEGYALGVSESNSLFLTGCMPIKTTADYPLKGGVLHKQRIKRQSMFFTFCPFCGEKFEVKP